MKRSCLSWLSCSLSAASSRGSDEMTDTAPTDIAAAWVAALTNRGVTLRVKGRSLEWIPGRAHGEMSDEELLTFRHHRAEIVAFIEARGGKVHGVVSLVPSPSTQTASPTQTAPEPPIEKCPYCNHTPCIGRSHHAYDDLHYYDPEHVEERRRKATEVMMRQIGRPLPDWYR